MGESSNSWFQASICAGVEYASRVSQFSPSAFLRETPTVDLVSWTSDRLKVAPGVVLQGLVEWCI